MTTVNEADTAGTTAEVSAVEQPAPMGRRPRWHALSPLNISAVYLAIALMILFTIWIPNVFWTTTTFRTLLNEQAVIGIAAIGTVIPVAARAFDLSVGVTLGAGTVTAAWLQVEAGLGVVPTIIGTVIFGIIVGALNGVMVVRFRIDSFIATLAMSSVLGGYAIFVTDNREIIGMSDSFRAIARGEWFGIGRAVYYLAILALILWYITEHTPIGRYLYATGAGGESARLAGVRTQRYVFGALVVGSAIAGLAGLVLVARIGSGTSEVGPGYLLPIIAAAFLGSTQFRNGRPNILGTVLAVYVLALGTKGLQLAGAERWVEQVFNGVALAGAVGLSRLQRRPRLDDSAPEIPSAPARNPTT